VDIIGRAAFGDQMGRKWDAGRGFFEHFPGIDMKAINLPLERVSGHWRSRLASVQQHPAARPPACPDGLAPRARCWPARAHEQPGFLRAVA